MSWMRWARSRSICRSRIVLPPTSHIALGRSLMSGISSRPEPMPPGAVDAGGFCLPGGQELRFLALHLGDAHELVDFFQRHDARVEGGGELFFPQLGQRLA